MAITNNVALQFNGVDERLEQDAASAFGIANLWTISLWLKPIADVPEEASADHHALLHVRGNNPRSEILIWGAKIEGYQEEEIYVELNSELGQQLRITRFNLVQKRNEWRHFSCVWDGTNLIAYDQGLLVQDYSTIVSGNGLQTEPTGGRSIRVGDHFRTGPSLAAWSGTLGHIGIWDTALGPAEFGPIISGGFGFDLSTTSGAYTSSAKLVHYWKPGDDFPFVGQDLVGTLDIASGTNATATGVNNVVMDQP
ncbi:MAG: hypothetical protein GF334_04950 [Candidatus Altiarchaeales archaeon]|nr:hypothetical protein [Candidatus Altiarchaeales archaeon]